MKKPYIKRLKKRGDVSIWRVDGNYIRNNIDVNFTNSSNHYVSNFIPEKEIWIDKDFGKNGDEELLAEHQLKERELLKKGMTYNQALAIAGKYEQKLRDESSDLKKKDAYKNLYIKKIPKYCKYGITTWLVNGKIVRDKFFINYTEGGHGYVFPFIPKDEIWLDNSLNPNEYNYVMYHEILERNLMKYNKKKYLEAHSVAINFENGLRRQLVNPDPFIINELKRALKN